MTKNGVAYGKAGRAASFTVLSRKPPLRMGIIGFGNIGRQHLQAMQPMDDIKVVAVADSRPIAKDGDLEEIDVFQQWEELLGTPGLDAVSVCVPHHLHAPIVMAALEAEKHVLVEKPLALNCAQGQNLLRAARERGLVLMVEMTHRFYPPLVEARQLVKAGRIGEIYAVEDRIIETASSQLAPWMQTKSLAGGGVALTNGVHMVDRIAMLTGQSLHFQSGVIGYGGGLGDVEDTASLLLKLDNGAPVQLLAGWPRGEAGCDDELTLYGTKATLRVWAWRGWRLEPLNNAVPVEERHCYPPAMDSLARVRVGLRGAFQEFAVAVLEGRKTALTASHALRAQELVEEFYEGVAVS